MSRDLKNKVFACILIILAIFIYVRNNNYFYSSDKGVNHLKSRYVFFTFTSDNQESRIKKA